MRVTVTEEDIKLGRRSISDRCPIALAVGREINQGSAISVQRMYVVVNGIEYALPVEASDFVSDYDSGRPVSPFTFSVEPRNSGS